MKQQVIQTEEVRLDRIVGEGRTIATMEDGRKLFVWGGLPGELVEVEINKKRSSYAEGVVTKVIEASPDRVAPKDPGSFLSTSPWQILSLEDENRYKIQLIDEAFAMHHFALPASSEMHSDGIDYGYRNKVEFSFWWNREERSLSLAFFKRGSHQKIEVDGTSLASDAINEAARRMIDILHARRHLNGMELKTFLVRSSRDGKVSGQLYVKSLEFAHFTEAELDKLAIDGFELIYSNPKSPASVITERMQAHGVLALTDTILDVPFRYATEGFFQINLPVYEEALRDMQKAIPANRPVVDLYSGVGTIGLTIGGDKVTLVEVNEHAVREMRSNIESLGKKGATAVLAPSEGALEYITADATIIVDPPRAGLHADVTNRLLEALPARIIYLSCNPATQARDVALLSAKYKVSSHRGYNFFPHTPHIEHLVVLDKA